MNGILLILLLYLLTECLLFLYFHFIPDKKTLEFLYTANKGSLGWFCVLPLWFEWIGHSLKFAKVAPTRMISWLVTLDASHHWVGGPRSLTASDLHGKDIVKKGSLETPRTSDSWFWPFGRVKRFNNWTAGLGFDCIWFWLGALLLLRDEWNSFSSTIVTHFFYFHFLYIVDESTTWLVCLRHHHYQFKEAVPTNKVSSLLASWWIWNSDSFSFSTFSFNFHLTSRRRYYWCAYGTIIIKSYSLLDDDSKATSTLQFKVSDPKEDQYLYW